VVAAGREWSNAAIARGYAIQQTTRGGDAASSMRSSSNKCENVSSAWVPTPILARFLDTVAARRRNNMRAIGV